MTAYINIRALQVANIEMDSIAAAYSFDDLEAGMILHAARRLGVSVWRLADLVYGWCCLGSMERSDWSVENIIARYRFAEGVC